MWKVERQSVGLAAVTPTDACPRVYIYIYYIQISLGIALAIPSDTPSDARLPWNRAGRPYYSYFYTLSDMLWIFKIEAGLGSDAPNVKNIKTVATAGTRPNLCFIIRTCIEFRCVLIWYVHHLHKLFSGCFLLPVLSIRPSSWAVSRATTWNLAHGLTSWCLNWSLVLSTVTCQDPDKVVKEERQKAIARLREIYTWQLKDVTEFLEVLKEQLHVNLREVEGLHYSKRMELQLQIEMVIQFGKILPTTPSVTWLNL